MNSMQNSNLVAAAVGATIGVVSVAAVLIYNKIMERQQKAAMFSTLDRVNCKVVQLQAEIEALRLQQLNLQKSRRKKPSSKKNITSPESSCSFNLKDDIDTYSLCDTDVADDEFYDCSDSEGAVEDSDVGLTEKPISDDNDHFSQIDKDMEDRSLCSTLYYQLKNLYSAEPKNIEVIWRFAKCCYYNSEQVSNLEKKKELISEGIDACEKVINIKDGNLYKWYAILVGIKSGFMGTKEKIVMGYLFKDYVEKALEINPNDSYLHHLLGRFSYEVATLTWIERKVASTLFAEVPKASYDDAIDCFNHAEQLAVKPYYENKLYLAKCYIAMKKYQQAILFLNEIKECQDTDAEMNKVKEKAKKLLCKYSSYCS